MTTPDIHALTGPYVLDAVADSERDAFESHLASCEDCRTEVSDLREAVTKLSQYVATSPPVGLRSKVMTVVREHRQVSPVRRTESVPRNEVVRPRLVRRSLILAAAFLAIAGSGVVALDQYRDNAASTAVSTRVTTILTQSDARTIHGAVSGGGQATVVLSTRQDAAVVLVRELRPLPSDKTYQLWFIDAAQNPRSIGLTNGSSLIPTVVTGGISGQVAFAVTVEPAAGSVRPTPPSTGGLQPIVRLDGPTA